MSTDTQVLVDHLKLTEQSRQQIIIEHIQYYNEMIIENEIGKNGTYHLQDL